MPQDTFSSRVGSSNTPRLLGQILVSVCPVEYSHITARQAVIVLNERDEFALGLRVPLDVALRHGQAGMAGELLHVPETPPDLRHAARRAGDEGAAPGMRRTAVHFQRRREPMKP